MKFYTVATSELKCLKHYLLKTSSIVCDRENLQSDPKKYCAFQVVLNFPTLKIIVKLALVILPRNLYNSYLKLELLTFHNKYYLEFFRYFSFKLLNYGKKVKQLQPPKSRLRTV